MCVVIQLLLHCLLMSEDFTVTRFMCQVFSLWESIIYQNNFWLISVDLSLSPVVYMCQWFKRAKLYWSGAGKQFVPKLLVYTSYSLLSVLCIWATKSCICSSCSFVSISISLGRLQWWTGSSLGRDKRNRRVIVNVGGKKSECLCTFSSGLGFFEWKKWHWAKTGV